MSLNSDLEQAITEVLHKHNAHPVSYLGILRFFNTEKESFSWIVFEPESANIFDTAGNAAFIGAWLDSNIYEIMDDTQCD